jgi:large subunit ribosomal protein L9
MEVILREHVDNLGRRGEIVKVADGYARNYLLPRKLALVATQGNKQRIERERATFEAKEAGEKKVAEGMAVRMAGVEIQIARKVGETEALYGSVTASDIADALAAKGFEIDRRKIQLREPIKKLAVIDVPIRLQRDVTSTVKVKVVAEGEPEKRADKKEEKSPA